MAPMCGRILVVLVENSVCLLEVKAVEASHNVGERQESSAENESIVKEEELKHNDDIKASENQLKTMETRCKYISQEGITTEQCCPVAWL